MRVRMCAHVYTLHGAIWDVEDKLCVTALLFYPVGLGDGTQLLAASIFTCWPISPAPNVTLKAQILISWRLI